MRTIVLAGLLILGLVSSAGARPRGGGSSSSGKSTPRAHSGTSGTGSSPTSHAVRGYTTKRGTYVAPHRQTTADQTQRNNYSTKGNVNPSNGKTGTKYAKH
jgi:hypothetical protein